MASKVAIANYALAVELGKDQISALTENTKGAKLMNLVFDDVAKEVMTLGAWSSATVRQTLAQDATAPNFGYSYRYKLPTDPLFLGLIKVNETSPGEIPHVIENGWILTDESSLDIKYKCFETDTEKWDPMLQRAIVLRLAERTCYTLTGNMDLKKTLLAEFTDALDRGMAIDGLNSEDDDELITNDLLDVRSE
jgi:hypothetical protein